MALDAALPEGCVRIARGIPETAALGEGEIALEKVARGARSHERALTPATAQGYATSWLRARVGPARRTSSGKSLAMIVMVLVPVLLTVLYYQLVERWVIGWIQVRKGPNRVGYKGILQPIADAIKLLMKEQMIPAGAIEGALPAGADHRGGARARRVGDRAVHARLGDRRRRRRRSW